MSDEGIRDWELLDQYTQKGSQEAFAQIVERYVDLAYTTCFRDLRPPPRRGFNPGRVNGLAQNRRRRQRQSHGQSERPQHAGELIRLFAGAVRLGGEDVGRSFPRGGGAGVVPWMAASERRRRDRDALAP